MTRPLLTRSLSLLAISASGVVVLLHIPGPTHPPGATPDVILQWWESLGTAGAATAVLRGVMLGVLIYTGAVALLAATLSVRGNARRPAIIAPFLTPALRRYLTGGALAVATMAPTAATAQESVPFVVVDLGPTDIADASHPTTEASFTVVDLGPVITTLDEPTVDPASPRSPGEAAHLEPATPADVWVVRRGDHLWSIAAETVADEIGDPSGNQIAHYWRKLIEANSSALGSDPDLIHPGQRISLPPV